MKSKRSPDYPWDTAESRVQRQVRFIPSYQDDGEELQILITVIE